MDYIHGLVRKRLHWIKKKIAEVESRPRIRQKRFVNGESFLYCGDPFRLRIVSDAAVPLVFRKGFILAAEHQSCARALLLEWYRQEAQRKIPHPGEVVRAPDWN